MGEGITGNVAAANKTTAISIFIKGDISDPCLESLKVLVKAWAVQCGVDAQDFTVKLKPFKKPAGKKPR